MPAALVAIDVQKNYTSPEYGLYCKDAKGTVQRINQLVRHFQAAGLPIILVRHMYRADGSDLGRMYDYLGEPSGDFGFKEGSDEAAYDPNLELPQEPIEITKNRYSAFAGTELESILRKRNVDRTVICGFMTNFCCESTAREAHDRDFFVDFVVDATGTPGTQNLSEKEIRSIVEELLVAGFARVISTVQCLEIDYR